MIDISTTRHQIIRAELDFKYVTHFQGRDIGTKVRGTNCKKDFIPSTSDYHGNTVPIAKSSRTRMNHFYKTVGLSKGNRLGDIPTGELCPSAPPPRVK